MGGGAYTGEIDFFEITKTGRYGGAVTYLRAIERLSTNNYSLYYLTVPVKLILGDTRESGPYGEVDAWGRQLDTSLWVMKHSNSQIYRQPEGQQPNAIFYTDGYSNPVVGSATRAEIQISHSGTRDEEGGYLAAGRIFKWSGYLGESPYFNLSNTMHFWDGAKWVSYTGNIGNGNYAGPSALINIQENNISFYTDDGTSTKIPSNYRLRIASDGNVYFGRLVDKADNNYYTQPSQDSFFNRIYANTYNSISDIRLKENIKPLAKPLAKILKLNGVQFNWKDSKEGSKKENIGLIAQDVEKVYPELVSTDKNGMKSVEYANLVAPLIEAIKEQQKEIETLRTEVEALKKR